MLAEEKRCGGGGMSATQEMSRTSVYSYFLNMVAYQVRALSQRLTDFCGYVCVWGGMLQVFGGRKRKTCCVCSAERKMSAGCLEMLREASVVPFTCVLHDNSCGAVLQNTLSSLHKLSVSL